MSSYSIFHDLIIFNYYYYSVKRQHGLEELFQHGTTVYSRTLKTLNPNIRRYHPVPRNVGLLCNVSWELSYALLTQIMQYLLFLQYLQMQ